MSAMESITVTACTMDCPDSCSLLVSMDSEGGIRIRGNPDHPFTAGFTCAKIRRLPDRLRDPRRILSPMLRSGSQWKPIDWEDALDLCAERIDALRSEPASILHFHGEGSKGVLKQASKRFFAQLGASRTKGSLCDAAGFIACLKDFGSRLNPDIEDLLNADTIINWGKDLSASSIHLAAAVRKARKAGATVLTVSPGGSEHLAGYDDHIQIRPGTDRFLAAAVLRLLLERDQISSEVISRVRSWEQFRNAVTDRSVAELAATCEVAVEDVERLCRLYTRKPVATIIGTGLQRYRFGGENVRYINALAMLSGNVGISGGGIIFHQHSLLNLNADWAKVPEHRARRALPMPEIGKRMLAAQDPPIRMIWINGSNVVNQAPDSRQVVEALKAIPFTVVVDAFMTDTADCADLVLPCTLMLEQEDIVGSFLTHYVHHVAQLVDPPGEARSDYEILADLGRRLNPPIILADKEACFEASLDLPVLDETPAELRAGRYARANRPSVPYRGLVFDHPGGRYQLPRQLHDEPPHPPGFPYHLLSLIDRDAMHSQILEEDQKIPVDVWVSDASPVLDTMGPEDAVRLVSPLGRMPVRLNVMPGLHAKTVVARRGTWMKFGGGLNQLVSAQLSDIGNGAPFYAQYVRLEKAPSEE